MNSLHLAEEKCFTCSGHIDLGSERCVHNPAGAIKLIASNACFLACPASARTQLSQRFWRKIFQCRYSLRFKRHEWVTAGRKLTAMIVMSPVNSNRYALKVDLSGVANRFCKYVSVEIKRSVEILRTLMLIQPRASDDSPRIPDT